ncbi:MAG: EAL domain-containing protein [Limnothrix sp.]
MNWPVVLPFLEIISYLLLAASYVATLVFISGQFQQKNQKLIRLFMLNFLAVITVVTVHLSKHLDSQANVDTMPLSVLVAAHCLMVLILVGLLLRFVPIFQKSKQSTSQSLVAAQQHLQQEQAQRQAAAIALQDSEDRFRSIFNNAAIGIVLINQSGRILNANRAYWQIWEDKSHCEADCFLSDGTHPEDIAQDNEAIAQVFHQKSLSHTYSKRYIHPHEGTIWANLHLTFAEPETPGSEPYAIAMVVNITQRKHIETELMQTRDHLKELLQTRTDQILQINEELSWQSSHDSLTGLLNRYTFERHLAKILNALNRKHHLNAEHTLCLLNLDRFKVINELGGSYAGDAVLRQVSQIIESRCRQTDHIARLGADEFALLLHQCSLEQAEKVALSIVERIQADRFQWQDQEYSISASIGLVPINESSGNTSEMMIAVDAACYAAKRRGRSRIHVYETNDQELVQYRSEAQWISKIEEALKNDSFQLYVQPIISMKPSLDIPHCEVLLRLISTNGDVISPGLFLPAAERYHLVTKIDYWVIEATLRYLASNLEQQTKPQIYSINLSGASINDDSLVQFIEEQFARYPVPKSMICFEVTETVAIANLNRANEVIQSIRAMGCSIALDDFGTGMSSFSYLKYLPVDYLKIDGSFIKDIVDDPIDFAMVETMNRIGHVMGIKTVAEYVSNEQILHKIQDIGIDYGQGFGLAHPRPLTAIQHSSSL